MPQANRIDRRKALTVVVTAPCVRKTIRQFCLMVFAIALNSPAFALGELVRRYFAEVDVSNATYRTTVGKSNAHLNAIRGYIAGRAS